MAAPFGCGFGDLVLASSRAVDDDEEEEEASQKPSPCAVLRWSAQAKQEISESPNDCIECSALIVAIGPVATGFIHTYLLHQETEILGMIGSGLSENTCNAFEQTSPADATCFLHRLKSAPSVILCQCNVDVPSEMMFSWTQQLFSCINIHNTYIGVLASAPVSEFRSSVSLSDVTVPFLRGLKTNQFHGKPVCPYLEQPNTVKGLPASVLSHCQVYRVPAVLYMCYSDSIYVEIPAIKAFLPVLKGTPFRDIVQENPHADITLRKLVELRAQQNNLYT
ncbi:proteasome assembly chaperone 1-like [Branchiostoma floridae x Branchiostoma belcheri]